MGQVPRSSPSPKSLLPPHSVQKLWPCGCLAERTWAEHQTSLDSCFLIKNRKGAGHKRMLLVGSKKRGSLTPTTHGKAKAWRLRSPEPPTTREPTACQAPAGPSLGPLPLSSQQPARHWRVEICICQVRALS